MRGNTVMKKNDLVPAFKKRKLQLVLCLYGGGRIGKSETLTELGRALLPYARYFYEQKGQQESRDRRIALKYCGRIIGIGTYGDNQDAIDRNFKFFEDQKCDIGITAARVEGGTDMKSYVERKCKTIRVSSIKKQDAYSSYSREIVKAVCIDHFIMAMKCKGIKEVKSVFDNSRKNNKEAI